MVFSWLFHGLDRKLGVFMNPETQSIKGVFMAFLIDFS